MLPSPGRRERGDPGHRGCAAVFSFIVRLLVFFSLFFAVAIGLIAWQFFVQGLQVVDFETLMLGFWGGLGLMVAIFVAPMALLYGLKALFAPKESEGYGGYGENPPVPPDAAEETSQTDADFAPQPQGNENRREA